jgi:aminoglycoside/choline kinase family phosphotransferase
MQSDERIAVWTERAIEERWPGARAGELIALKGDVSMRRFWRVAIEDLSASPASAIAIDLGPEDLPLYARELKMYPQPLAEQPWIGVHRFLVELGAPVPALYHWSARDRMLLVEDVGAISLFEAARANQAKAADLYREAVKVLLRFHVDAMAAADRDCIAFRIAYDQRLFRWEMDRFIVHGLSAIAPNVNHRIFDAEVDSLARELGALPRVFSHRDFHGNNIFLQGSIAAPTLRIIDFQDALMAPAAQDLAVLLTTRDTCDLIPPPMEDRLLDFYYACLIRRGAQNMSRDEFLRSYAMCVLQHALKCIGLFVSLEREGKRAYAVYTPYAIGQARRMLARLAPEFPQLRTVLG